MPSCLGIYLEDNIIKYAKVSKERDNIKIDSYGVKFFENIDDALKQIVSETYSYNKVPISINLSEEKYAYSNVFSLLNKKDIEKAVNTEFEYFCNETKKHKNTIEYRRLFSQNEMDKDKTAVLFSYADKTELVAKTQLFNSYKLNYIMPLPLSIKNLVGTRSLKNSMIVNIEDKTTVTTIINGEIKKVNIIEYGMKQILDAISVKENSYAKAYEICKNSTIYTQEGKNLQLEENDYLEDIMPTLYTIIEEIKKISMNSEVPIDDLYLSGSATVINNIDLYFQENFLDKKCEILTPSFANKSNLKINIRDYIEVNSAIALALEGIGEGTKEINFKNNPAIVWSDLMKIEIGKPKEKGEPKKVKSKLIDGKRLDNIEKSLIRTAVFFLMLFIIYMVFDKLITSRIDKKGIEADEYIARVQSQIDKLDKNKGLIAERTKDYETIIEKINEQNNRVTENNLKKNAIPNLMNKIMFVIPKEVQLLSITNVEDKKIKIEAQSKKYEQLGYFVATLKTETILTDVSATVGTKANNIINVTIEGNLPY